MTESEMLFLIRRVEEINNKKYPEPIPFSAMEELDNDNLLLLKDKKDICQSLKVTSKTVRVGEYNVEKYISLNGHERLDIYNTTTKQKVIV